MISVLEVFTMTSHLRPARLVKRAAADDRHSIGTLPTVARCHGVNGSDIPA